MMKIKPIRSDEDHKVALAQVSPLFEKNPAPGTPEGDFLDIMIPLIAAYEEKRYPIDPPSAIEAIKFRMEQGGMTVKNVAAIIKSETSRVYEILSGKRGLTLNMIRALHRELGIPLAILVAEPKEKRVAPAAKRATAKAVAPTRAKVAKMVAAKQKTIPSVRAAQVRATTSKTAATRARSSAKA